MVIPKNLTRAQAVNYRRWIGAGKGRAQAAVIAKSGKASRRP